MLIVLFCIIAGIHLERNRVYNLLRLGRPTRGSVLLRIKALCVKEKGLYDFPQMEAQECLDILEDYLLRGNYERQSDPLRNNCSILTSILCFYSPWYRGEVDEAVEYLKALRQTPEFKELESMENKNHEKDN